MNETVVIGAIGAERLEIVSSADRLAAIEAAWTSLWQRNDGLIFQSHGWISAWWSTVADRRKRALKIGLVWNDDRLVAVVPLATCRRKGLRFLEWAANSYSDYGDILVAPECSQSALEQVWARIWSEGGFDIAFINRLLPDAAAHRIFAPGVSGGIKLRRNHREEVSYRVSGQWANGAEWLATHPKKTRQNYRRGLRILEEAGEVTFRLLAPDEPLQPVLERLSVLKRRWLVQNSRESDLFQEGESVLAALVDVLARAGVLRIFVIECNGAMVAVSINIVQHDVMMAFVTTYDPEFSRASPGVVLIVEYIQWSMDNGLRMVDFLCGGYAFKSRFATEAVTLQSVLGERTPLGSLVSFADGVRQKIKSKRESGSASEQQDSSPEDAA
ncbi:GNAT family N-acetyltransferase [Mesorhizobium loti]|nr:GNAT family N-acetyltransferase [Mesorhizobium loti]PLP55795.1 GNAT family N-acetyltransferase [Mesorhizobium loti]